MIKEVTYRQFGGLWSVVINIGGTEHVLSPEVADMLSDLMKHASMKAALSNQDERSKAKP